MNESSPQSPNYQPSDYHFTCKRCEQVVVTMPIPVFHIAQQLSHVRTPSLQDVGTNQESQPEVQRQEDISLQASATPSDAILGFRLHNCPALASTTTDPLSMSTSGDLHVSTTSVHMPANQQFPMGLLSMPQDNCQPERSSVFSTYLSSPVSSEELFTTKPSTQSASRFTKPSGSSRPRTRSKNITSQYKRKGRKLTSPKKPTSDKPPPAGVTECFWCGLKASNTWREGPYKINCLCNKCGNQYNRVVRKKDEAALFQYLSSKGYVPCDNDGGMKGAVTRLLDEWTKRQQKRARSGGEEDPLGGWEEMSSLQGAK